MQVVPCVVAANHEEVGGDGDSEYQSCHFKVVASYEVALQSAIKAEYGDDAQAMKGEVEEPGRASDILDALGYLH
jgi:hypothetical protein